ncbi:hypothetical protein LSTR_LSTR004784 [Laodelphax striatellus]|uniref:Transmembrane protein 231 n=1 Tax=Laodelphax striatellus TaxID=195883 RepID=A0A482XLE2_LAOST|nr:hypothetical protein LSTR_LSTR004784 [Laodelphax striatellus]
MVLYEVFSHPVLYTYKGRLFSKATALIIFTTFLTFFLPLLFAFKTHGFWLKSASYREKPDVSFKYEYFFMLHTERIVEPIICTSVPVLNNVFKNRNSCPIIRVKEDDINADGFNDVLSFELEALLNNDENVFGLTLILIFEYNLYSHCYLEMESMAVIQEMTSMPGSRFDIAADLQLIQKSPMNPRIRHTMYRDPIFHSNSFNLQETFKEYSMRNLSTRLTNSYSTWTYGRAITDPFILKVQIDYPETLVTYQPGFWQEIKWSWTQYFSVLVPIILVFRELKKFIFSNHLIHTFSSIPWIKDK